MLFLGKLFRYKRIILSRIRVEWLKKHLIIVICALLLYVLNRFYLKNLGLPYISIILKNHFNDFIGGFVFPAYVNIILVVSNRFPINHFCHLFVFMLGVSLIWEYVFPLLLSYSTSDILDVFSYLLGTIIYYSIMHKENNKIVEI